MMARRMWKRGELAACSASSAPRVAARAAPVRSTGSDLQRTASEEDGLGQVIRSHDATVRLEQLGDGSSAAAVTRRSGLPIAAV